MAQQVPDEYDAVAVDDTLLGRASQQDAAKALVQHAACLVFDNDEEDPDRRLNITCIEELMLISPIHVRDLRSISLPPSSDSNCMEIRRWKELSDFLQDRNEFSMQTSMADVIRTNLAARAKQEAKDKQCLMCCAISGFVVLVFAFM